MRGVTPARASRGNSVSAVFSPSSPRRGPAVPAPRKRKRRLGCGAGKVTKGSVDEIWPRRKRRHRSPGSGAGRGAALRRALRRGPKLAPERLALAAAHGGRAATGLSWPRAGGRRSAASAVRWHPGARSAQRQRGIPGRGPCGPPGASHGKVVSRRPGCRIHLPAGEPAAARCARASAPPASSRLPPSLLLPARAGAARGARRGRRGRSRAFLALGSAACRGGGDVSSSAEKSCGVARCGCSSFSR